MGSILIRNIPEDVHQRLRDRAKRDGVSVQALVGDAVARLADPPAPRGIDFDLLARLHAEMETTEIADPWPADFDDPAWGNRIFGLDAAEVVANPTHAQPRSEPPK